MTFAEVIEKFVVPVASQGIGATALILLWTVRNEFKALRSDLKRVRLVQNRMLASHAEKYPDESFELMKEEEAA